MAKINFFLTHRKVDGKAIKKPRPIYAYVYYVKGKRTAYPTGLTIQPKFWDKDKQQAKGKAPGAHVINRQLAELRANILNILAEMDKEHPGAPAATRRQYLRRGLDMMTGRSVPVQASLTSFITTFCEERVTALKSANKGGRSPFTGLAYRWGEYIKEKYSSNRKPVPEFSDLNRTLLTNFAAWLLEQHPIPGGHKIDTTRTLSRGTVEQILIKLKQAVRAAEDAEQDAGRELQINLSFDRANINDILDRLNAEAPPVREGVYLKFAEIRQLYEFDLSEWAEGYRSVRDTFVAACLCGLRRNAWSQVTKSAVQFEIDGVAFQLVNLQGGKNSKKQSALIPQYGYIKDILDRWGGRLSTKGISAHGYLNKIAKAAGLNRMIQVGTNEYEPLHEVLKLHSSRTTFISNARALEMPDHYLQRITTHQGTSIADGYDRRQLEEKAAPLVKYLHRMQASIEKADSEAVRLRKIS